MGRFLKSMGLGVAAFLLFLLLLVAVLSGMARSRVPSWPDELPGVRLEPARPILRESQVSSNNAYFFLRQLDSTNVFHLADDARRELPKYIATGLKGTNYPALEAWFEKSQPAIELLAKAAATTNCQVATYDRPDTVLKGVPNLLSSLKLLSFHAELCASNGDWNRALDEERKIIRLSQHVTRGGTLIHHLIGIAGENMACTGLMRLGAEYAPTPEWTRNAITLLREADASREPFAEAMRHERKVSISAVEMAYAQPGAFSDILCLSGRDEPDPGPSWTMRLMSGPLALMGSTVKRTTAHFDALYSRIILIASEPYVKGRLAKEVEYLFDFPGKRWSVLADDPMGRVLGGLLLPAFDSALQRATLIRAKLCGAQLFLAVCQHQRDRGRLPATLDELVPDYVPALPADPFRTDGGPFRWRSAEGVWCVYSVGPDQQDDGGQSDFEEARGRHGKDAQHLDVCLASDRFIRSREAAKQRP